MPETADRFHDRYDAVLHLLDRQVISSDGLLVCKVDDLELVETGDGVLVATALLAGTPALLPRLSGRLGAVVRDFWVRMGDEQADRRLPYRIDFALVAELTSAVTLTRPRHGVLARVPGEGGGPTRHRLGELLSMAVEAPEGQRRILDLRLDERHRVRSLVIGHGRPGAMLGYDEREGRTPNQGPALVRTIVRALHRHAREVPFDLVRIDWQEQRVRLAG